MNKLDKIIKKKYDLYKKYEKNILSENIRMKKVPISTSSPVHWFSNIVCEDAEHLQKFLASFGIPSRRIFYPLNEQPCLKNHRSVFTQENKFVNSIKAFRTILSLPSSILMKNDQFDFIIEKLNKY